MVGRHASTLRAALACRLQQDGITVELQEVPPAFRKAVWSKNSISLKTRGVGRLASMGNQIDVTR
jgi:hypothetical protein